MHKHNSQYLKYNCLRPLCKQRMDNNVKWCSHKKGGIIYLHCHVFYLYTGLRSRWKFLDAAFLVGQSPKVTLSLGPFVFIVKEVRLARMILQIMALQSLHMFIRGPCSARGGGGLVTVLALCSEARRRLLML